MGFFDSISAMGKATDEVKLDAIGEIVAETARTLVPVDTGRLRDSIDYRIGRDDKGPFVDVGATEIYAPFVEWGTVNMAPEPFLSTAAEAERARIGEAFAAEIVRTQRDALAKFPKVIEL